VLVTKGVRKAADEFWPARTEAVEKGSGRGAAALGMYFKAAPDALAICVKNVVF
jgi:hypothetical protein